MNARQVAFYALRAVHQGAFADVALDRVLGKAAGDDDRRLATELVYGSVRRQRTLDALITQLAKKPAHEQPPDLRLILHLGLYQLRYLNQIPPAAAAHTTVELAKQNKLGGLAGLVNGILRQYLRLAEQGEPITLPDEPIARLATLHSYPDWIVQLWIEQFGIAEAEQLCLWFNHPPHLDLRINPLQGNLEQVKTAMQQGNVAVDRVPPLPQALRLVSHAGAIWKFPGFKQGWWTVQDSSSQLVSHLLDPQPGEMVIDGCAAPGGKTTHIAELMGDRGVIWACDRNPSRLKKVEENAERLQLTSIRIHSADSRTLTHFANQADRVLLDAPCSGLGTLHRHADARWRQTPHSVQTLTHLQSELLAQAATWVRPGGVLVYSTCTLHPAENEAIVQRFLESHHQWQVDRTTPLAGTEPFATTDGWYKILPHQHRMDGFFVARLKKSGETSG